MITKVQLPMSREALVLATNQGLLYVLSMVVIGGMVGGGSLGYIVVSGFSQDQLFGKGLAAGIAIAALGVMLDRIARYAGGALRRADTLRLHPRTRRAELKEGNNSMARGLRRLRLVALAAVVGLGLAACGGGDIKNTDTAGERQDCGDLSIAVNPWTGYVANAHVIGHVAKTKLGCNVTYPDVKEEVGWQGMATGRSTRSSRTGATPTWSRSTSTSRRPSRTPGRPATRASSAGTSRRGWPKKYPDITDWKNLNKYADMFKTSESGGKGQLLDGDPSYVTNDEALVKNLNLNYKVVVGGSEAGADPELPSPRRRTRSRCSAYFYEPQWFFAEVTLVKVDLPPYKPGLRRRPGQGRLRLPAVPAEQADRHEVRRVRLAGRRPDQELQVDQRRPEPGREVHRRGRHVARTTPPRSGSTPTRTRSTPG